MKSMKSYFGKNAKTPKRPASKPAARKKPSPSKLKTGMKRSKNSMLWVDKYKPRKMAELIGNPECVKRIAGFLNSWSKIIHAAAGKTGKSRKSTIKKACLLSGPPGIGKSSAAAIVADQLGWETVEMNASDSRSKKSVKAAVEQMLGNRSLTEFWHTPSHSGNTFQVGGKTVLIMDEVDGMSSGDRGGMAELIKLIQKTKIPIICICNDRRSTKVRSLANYCIDIRFRRPTPLQVTMRLTTIARNEGINIDRPTVAKIAESCHGDIRQMLNILQLWSKDPRRAVTLGEVKERLSGTAKDIEVGPWDVVPSLFRKPQLHERARFLGDRMNAYFVDVGLVPLMVQENYLHSKVRGISSDILMDQVDKAASFISDGDLIDVKIRSQQNYTLMPLHGTISCVAPSYCVAGDISRLQFPSWLGRNSTRGKNYRLLSELSIHSRRFTTGSPSALGLDYLPALREKVTAPLAYHGKGGIDSVLETMLLYSLTRDDWETITTLGDFARSSQPQQPIPSVVRSAFTRRYNNEVHISHGESITTRGDMKSISSVQQAEEAGDNGVEEAEGEEEDNKKDDLSSDKLIKAKKKSKRKPKKTPKKRAASSSSSAKAARSKPKKKRKTKK